jgi:hypothetical protein
MKILGVNSSGQPLQMNNGTITTFGNAMGWGFATIGSDRSATVRPMIAFPNYDDGRVQLFCFIGNNGYISTTTAPVFTSYEGLVKLPITYSSGTFTKGATVTGSVSGATGTIAETYSLRFSGSPTELYVDNVTSGPFVNTDVLSGAGVATVNSTPSTDGLGDAWKIDTTVSCEDTSSAGTYAVRAMLGWWPVNVAGATQLALGAFNASAQVAISLYDPETNTWSTDVAANGFNVYHTGMLRRDGKLYYLRRDVDSNSLRVVDFSTGTPVFSGGYGFVGAYTPQNMTMGIHQGDIFCAHGGGNVQQMKLSKFTESGWSVLGPMTTAGNADSVSRGCVFESPDGELMVLWSAGGGTVARRITSQSPFTYESATSYLPTGFSSLADDCIFVVRDRSTNGATGLSDVHVIWQDTANGNISVARCDAWNDWTDLGSNSSGTTVLFGDTQDGDFGVLYEDGANLGILTGETTAVPGGQQFKFRIFGSGSANFELLVEEGTMTSGTPTRGTLGSPSEGTLTDGNKKITGVTADGNEKTAVWLGSTDGFSDGDFVQRTPFIST